MIVDIHTHTFPDRIAVSTIQKLSVVTHTVPPLDGSMAALRSSMAEAGVDISMVLPVATNTKQVPKVNEASAELNANGGNLRSFGCIHPDYADWKMELARVAELGMRGVKLHPVYQGVDFDDIRYLRILDRCGELGLTVLSHAGLDTAYPGVVHAAPDMVLRAVRQVGPVNLILAHMGGWLNWDQVEELLTDTGVCVDTAYALGDIFPLDDGFFAPEDLPLMGLDQFLRLVRKFGADRVLFGTDSPWRGQKETMDQICALPLTQGEKDAILGGNAVRMLGL